MLGATTTKLVLHEIGGNGRYPHITKVDKPGIETLTTRDIPMPLVKNLMSLHNREAPGAVNAFAKNAMQMGLMDELLAEVVEPRSLLSTDRRVDMKNPEKLMEAFYAATFLQNEQAKECLVYSQEGSIVAMAQIGSFAPDVKDLSCTISNLMISSGLDATSQSVIVQHVASQAKQQFGEASLITAESRGSLYESHGFNVTSQPAIEEQKDPVASRLLSRRGAAVKKSQGFVRCVWQPETR